MTTVIKSIYVSAVRQLQVGRKFTLEFTTIVRTISFVNNNGWSHTDSTMVVSPTTVYDLSWIEPLISV